LKDLKFIQMTECLEVIMTGNHLNGIKLCSICN